MQTASPRGRDPSREGGNTIPDCRGTARLLDARDGGDGGEPCFQLLVGGHMVGHLALVEGFVGVHIEVARARQPEQDHLLLAALGACLRLLDGHGTWEVLYNPDFKVVEFDHFKSEAGLHTFTLSAKEWVEKTNAIGIYVQAGRYGGTYAHKDIAFEFGSAISPVFKLYLLKEYQRLKEDETDRLKLEWNAKRFLTKNNYLIHTDAVKNYVLPKSSYTKNTEWLAYADEADLLNVALFGCTAKSWREANPELAKHNNIRDFASISELTVLSNLETHNAELIKRGMTKSDRFKILQEIAQYQLHVLTEAERIKELPDADSSK